MNTNLDHPKDQVHPPRKYFPSPFPFLRLNNLLHHGGQAVVLAFPGCIVCKIPIQWGLDEKLPVQAKRGVEIEERVAAESMISEERILSILQHHPHPSILKALRIVPEGTFFPRMRSSLDDRIIGYRDLYYRNCYASETLKMQWISQIIGAAAWLKSLGLVHGDLTPRNILLDRSDNVKLADFGESVRQGGYSQFGAPAYVPWVFEIRDHRSEQCAIGWTIYNIYRDPPPEFDGPEDLNEWGETEFPGVDNLPLGCVIRQCWQLQYDSVAALEYDFNDFLVATCPWYSRATMSLWSCWGRIIDHLQHWMLRRKCNSKYVKLLQHDTRCGLLDYSASVDEMPKPLARNPRHDP